MTAAHKSLPFGTKVIVTNINNSKKVTVTINDRGPYVKGRIIDLAQAAFSKIEKLDKGIAEVKIRVVN
jgi:rare lipoprotein A